MIKITPETKIVIITPTDQGEERTTIGPCSTCSYEDSCDGSTYYNDVAGDYSDLKLHMHEFCSNWTDDPAIKASQTSYKKQSEQQVNEYISNFEEGYRLLFQRELYTMDPLQLSSFKKETKE